LYHYTHRDITNAWAGGLFDGEGTINISNSSVSIKVCIQMTDLDVLEKMKKEYGGQIIICVKQADHHKQSWSWYISDSKKSIAFLNEIYPWLGKRRQSRAEEARIKYQSSQEIKKQKIRELRHSGLTQQAIADKVGCRREHVNRVLNGKS